MHRALKTCQKPGVITRKSQLFNKKRCRHLNTGHLIKWQKITHFQWKRSLLDNFSWVLGHVCIRMTSIFHACQFFINSGHILDIFRAKKWLIFHPLSTLISLPGWLPKAITAPWKCSLRVQWWNTFQLGPKKPPKPLLAKKNSSSPDPKLHSQPSVHWDYWFYDK